MKTSHVDMSEMYVGLRVRCVVWFLSKFNKNRNVNKC